MGDENVTIDRASLADNPGERQVEFMGDAAGDLYAFAVRYEVLEALSGQRTIDDPLALLGRFTAEIEQAAGRALARNSDVERVIVSGNDID